MLPLKLLQNKSVSPFVLESLKKLSNLPHLVVSYFFAVALSAIIFGAIAAGLLFWQWGCRPKESSSNEKFLPQIIDENAYGQAIEAIQKKKVLIQEISPERYHDIFKP